MITKEATISISYLEDRVHHQIHGLTYINYASYLFSIQIDYPSPRQVTLPPPQLEHKLYAVTQFDLNIGDGHHKVHC